MTRLAHSPVVAIVVGREPDDRFSIYRGYVEAVTAVGAVPLVLPALNDAHDRLVEMVVNADALLLSGGGDVDPRRYEPDGTVAPETSEVDPARDRLEIWAYLAARARGKRVLGICRGIQLIAVAAGGSLHQHLPAAGFQGHWNRDLEFEPSHAIKAESGSLAADALAGATKINSIHHQGVADPGELRATAWADDGLIEAIEGEDVLGIQWHPERLLDFDSRHLAPFKWLVGAA